MHARLLIAIAVSGVVHAGAFVIGAGSFDRYLSALDSHQRTITLTVSVVSTLGSSIGTEAGKERLHSQFKEALGHQPPYIPVPATRRSSVHREVRSQASLRHYVRSDGNAPATAEEKAKPITPKERQVPQRREPESPIVEHSRQTTDTQLAATSERVAEARLRKASEEQYLTELLTELSKHKFYPRSARLSRQEGRAVVSFVLGSDGSIGEIELAESSRFSALDHAAVRAVQQLHRFKPFPSIIDRKNWQLSVPFQYSITDR